MNYKNITNIEVKAKHYVLYNYVYEITEKPNTGRKSLTEMGGTLFCIFRIC